MMAMSSENVGRGEVINVGAGHEHSVLEVADIIGGEKVFIEKRLEPQRTLADISLAKKLLGWEPRTSLKEGIATLMQEAGLA